MNAFKEFLNKNKRVLIGGGIGLLVGILMLTIGFFATLLLILLTGIGVLFGARPDLFNTIKAAVTALFRKIFKKG
ncbi:MAG: DUF2273 domain-containing protein [Christensenellaceae bacterium]|nr:DUF2273 domain-containing protein [Christensenellaceae bacterium]